MYLILTYATVSVDMTTIAEGLESVEKVSLPQEDLCAVTFADNEQDFLERCPIVPPDTPADKVGMLSFT